MVYIISCPINRTNKKELEEIRQHFMHQINEGILMLPLGFTLEQVVDTPEGNAYRPASDKEKDIFSWDGR